MKSDFLQELEQRLVLVYVGKPHSSSDVHAMVIRECEEIGPNNSKLERMRQLATAAAKAFTECDIMELGRLMCENTAAQQALHPALVGEHAHAVIELAKQHNAIGWKVNGAGGDGGSVTVLFGQNYNDRTEFLEALLRIPEHGRLLPIKLCHHGLQVTVYNS